MSSTKPPKPSSGAETKTLEKRPAPLVAAATLLAERGVYGLIWLDAGLNVVAHYGRLVEFADIGEPITSSFLPLVGLEQEIAALKAAEGAVLELPAVSVVTPRGASPRINVAALWSPEEDAFVLLVSRTTSRSDLEGELSRQIRARLIAEAEVTQKSRELARANTELERANRDLEEFAAIISHDLKAPLRAMRYLVGDLEQQMPADGGEAAREKLNAIREQSQRMSGMLTALLEYSSVGRKEEAVEAVDTHALALAVVRSMPRPADIRIEIQGIWPQIETLAAPLDLVLRNLIDNAIKHHDQSTGLITVRASDTGAALEIVVSDDGPGIALHHQEAVFLPFRKLVLAGEAGGHGMGLAFVKRTVEVAGGRLDLVSDPTRGRGSKFRVTWPKSIPRTS